MQMRLYANTKIGLGQDEAAKETKRQKIYSNLKINESYLQSGADGNQDCLLWFRNGQVK